MKLRVALIGLGAIGAQYESEDAVLNHATAYSAHPLFDLITGVDPSIEAREKFSRKYKNCKCLENIDGFKSGDIDVFSVAVNTSAHFSTLEKLIQLNPIAIFVEKPFCENILQAQHIYDLARRRGVKLMVNYFRHYEQGHQTLRKQISEGRLGRLIRGHLVYQRGLLNNASHFVHYFISAFGRPYAYSLAKPKCKLESNGLQENPRQASKNFTLYWESGSIDFTCLDDLAYNLFEFNLYTDGANIIYRNGGSHISVRKLKGVKDFSKRPALPDMAGSIDGSLNTYQAQSLLAFLQLITEDKDWQKDVELALDVHRIVEKILDETQSAEVIKCDYRE